MEVLLSYPLRLNLDNFKIVFKNYIKVFAWHAHFTCCLE